MTNTDTLPPIATPKILMFRASEFSDAVARALIAQAHREVREDIAARFLGETGCGRTVTAEACGGCRDCTYAQATWHDLTGDGFARWRARAAELITLIRGDMAGAR